MPALHDRQENSTEATSWHMQVLVGLIGATVLVIVAYFYVDLPVLRFVRERGLTREPVLRWLILPPEAFVIASPFVLLAGLVRRWFAPWTRRERVAVVAAIATLLAALAAGLLKIAIGRAGPVLVPVDVTALHDGIYGFYPFNLDNAYWAVPSGHTACTFSVTCVVQAACPRARLLCWLLDVLVPAALVCLSHHFVGDVFAGAFLGWAIAGTMVRWFGLELNASPQSP